MKITIEVLPGEGGEDAKLLAEDQLAIYKKFALKNCSKVVVGGSWLAITTSEDIASLFMREAGGHRWQRIPPTESKGRVQTSTTKVSVIEEGKLSITIDEGDIITRYTKDSGPGGQHRNKTESCVVMRHLPTGIEAKASSKSQHQNRVTARQLLEQRVQSYYASRNKASKDLQKKTQQGSGGRAEKIRTYRFKDNRMVDHRSGKKFPLSLFLSGKLHKIN